MPKYKRVKRLSTLTEEYKYSSRSGKYIKKNTEFELIRNTKKYKSERQYINAVYRHNKKIIDKKIDKEFVDLHGTANKAFNALVIGQTAEVNPYTKKNYTPKEAIKRVMNSLQMMGDFESELIGEDLRKEKVRYIHGKNFENLLKKDKNVWKEFRMNDLRIGGRFVKYNPFKLQYLGYYHDAKGTMAVYQYEDTYITVRQSPHINDEGEESGASIERYTKFQWEQVENHTILKGKSK